MLPHTGGYLREYPADEQFPLVLLLTPRIGYQRPF
jgi:hypothetical protein